ncbi:MAG: transcriptional regulator FtrA [Holophagales bacterium]|nr:transcriptional regulator FtrA [Holophagales bacterium]
MGKNQQDIHSRLVTLTFEGFPGLELGMIVDIFGRERPELDVWYSHAFCSADPSPVRGQAGLMMEVQGGLELLETADTIIVPGWRSTDEPPSEELLEALRDAYGRGARLLSICIGAFALAATGLLDGRRATTHWAWTEELAWRYPAIRVEPGVLYVDEGRIQTSAGSAAGIDLCLHMIRNDLGAAAANAIARRLVVPPHRDGGQSQYIDHPISEPGEGSLSPLLDWVRLHLAEEHSVESLAARAGLSPRTFARRFQQVTGTSPHRWLTRERIFRAQELLETTDASVDRVAEDAGFGSAQVLRLHYRRHLGTTPSAYRRTFRHREATA